MTALSIRSMNDTLRQREWLMEKELEQAKNEARERNRRFEIEWDWNVRRLERLDPNAQAWWETVYEGTTRAQGLVLIKRRIENLKEYENKCKKFDFVWYWRDNAPAVYYVDQQMTLLKEAKKLGAPFVAIYEKHRKKAQNPYVIAK